uniref:tribbles homolog 2 n=1 Tax=Ciona intestinalis TaxID=7719 RepID=UPI0000521F8A|nr:tribbles homolog 2 [Ciona intestinalis]|eukprot:XP_002131182.1 tribbles homolog 2 [Ciona intestinalis]
MNVQRSSPISIRDDSSSSSSFDSAAGSPVILPERTRHDTISRVKSSLDFHRTRTNSISPGLASPTPPTFIPDGSHRVSHIGKYLLVEHIEGHNTGNVFRAVDYNTEEEFICKVYKRADYMKVVDGYFRVAPHPHINSVVDVVVGPTNAYLFFLPGVPMQNQQNVPEEGATGFHAENLHSYVRSKQRLQEVAAAPLFKQVVSAVAHVHKNNIVLRDLKLRKFIFRDMERTELMLESLEEACVLEDDDDNMTDRHGCPAYASPEILSCSAVLACSNTLSKSAPSKKQCVGYSGKASDVWSLGVMLYTLLVGRYPFHESDPRALFVKISRGHFSLPDTLSSEARNLIRSLLKKNPSERLSSQEILDHPWLKRLGNCWDVPRSAVALGSGGDHRHAIKHPLPFGRHSGGHSLPLSLYSTPYYDDQMVPDVATTSTSEEEHDEIFTFGE